MRSPARYEGGTTADASWRAVSAAADVTLSGIAHGYTELRERGNCGGVAARRTRPA